MKISNNDKKKNVKSELFIKYKTLTRNSSLDMLTLNLVRCSR